MELRYAPDKGSQTSSSKRRASWSVTVLRVCLGAVVVGLGAGCETLRALVPSSMRGVDAPPADHTIAAGELDELTRAFADRYVGLLSSTCDALKKDNPDPVQRREAQALMLDCATNVYDIASNADAFTRMLDLVVVTTLVSFLLSAEGQQIVAAGGHVRLNATTLAQGRQAIQ